MWTLAIFLCLNDLPSDQCNEETAVQVTRPTQTYSQLMTCALDSMRILPMWEQADDTTHAKVQCVQRGDRR